MITYPSTHGVFEQEVQQICALVHDAGIRYTSMGRTWNALVGRRRLAGSGADVSHLNLHKTFCIPARRWWPRVGPVGVRAHLAPYLPTTHSVPMPVRLVAGSPAGSWPGQRAPGEVPVCFPSLCLHPSDGADGLRDATRTAILSANYLASRLGDTFRCCTPERAASVAQVHPRRARHHQADQVTVDDIAKEADRLWVPRSHDVLPGLGHLDDRTDGERGPLRTRPFRGGDDRHPRRIDEIAAGTIELAESPCGRRHTAVDLAKDWDRSYERMLAAYPVAFRRTSTGRR